jgi:hypothetical protein
MSAPAVSQHLRVLEDAGLVAIRKAGRRRFYKLDPAPLRDVVTWADAFAAYFSARLDDLGAYLDRAATAAGADRGRRERAELPRPRSADRRVAGAEPTGGRLETAPPRNRAARPESATKSK